MTPDPAGFRRVLGRFTTGVTVVTTCDAERRPAGLTVNAFASVSLDPPLVLACVDRRSETHDLIAGSGIFAVNILARGQEAIARRFADDARELRFEGIAWRTEQTGAPVFDEVLAWIDCRVHAAVPAGDHTIYIGEVRAADARDGDPLVFYTRSYGRFTRDQEARGPL